VQKSDIAAFVSREGWGLVRWYTDECRSGARIDGRDAFKSMMRDAAKGEFDVVVVFDVTRFGRDGLDVLESARTLKRDFGVDVIDTKGAFDTRHRGRTLANFVHAGVAESERISILERTKRGKLRVARDLNAPTANHRPWGRVWVAHGRKRKDGGHWKVDPDKQRIAREMAQRYLAGEAIPDLAVEFGLGRTAAFRLLHRRCGGKWVQRVRCPDLGIDETVVTTVPPLLDDDTLAAIAARADANRTFRKGSPKHSWLLGHFVFCAECGTALYGQTHHRSRGLYYRHGARDKAGRCPLRPRPWVDAAVLEEKVLRELFDLFGNPAAVRRAVEACTPDRKAQLEKTERLARVNAGLAKVAAAKGRIVDSIAEGIISDRDASAKLTQLREREAALEQESRTLAEQLANVPTAEQVREGAERVVRYADAWLIAKKNRAATDYDALRDSPDARELLCEVFGGKAPDGKRQGVYVSCLDPEKARGKRWTFRIVGRLIDITRRVTSSPRF
jgi:DNA invertase Pin-like site-specific DNA recombinase